MDRLYVFKYKRFRNTVKLFFFEHPVYVEALSIPRVARVSGCSIFIAQAARRLLLAAEPSVQSRVTSCDMGMNNDEQERIRKEEVIVWSE
jgi:hypothetical protein